MTVTATPLSPPFGDSGRQGREVVTFVEGQPTTLLANGTYSGIVKYDTGYTANVTVNEGTVWNLTGNATVTKLVNNGTINKNGYTLTYSSLSGSGTINETTGIEKVKSRGSDGRGDFYTLDGRRADASVKGIVIQDGKKVVKK